MIQLYGFDTINTLKVLMFLIETDVEYEYIPINIRTGEQHTPEFRAINPAGKVPVIIDGAHRQTESNSILLSLAQKTGWGLPDDPDLHTDLTAWLFYQASTQGPYFGQIEYWSHHAKTPNAGALEHYRTVAGRTIEHLDNQLNGQHYMCGDAYSIADISLFPWLNIHRHLGLSLEQAGNLAGWLARVRQRPGTKSALAFFGADSFLQADDSAPET